MLFRPQESDDEPETSASEESSEDEGAAPWVWGAQPATLHQEISSFASWVGPDEEEIAARELVQRDVERALQVLWCVRLAVDRCAECEHAARGPRCSGMGAP